MAGFVCQVFSLDRITTALLLPRFKKMFHLKIFLLDPWLKSSNINELTNFFF